MREPEPACGWGRHRGRTRTNGVLTGARHTIEHQQFADSTPFPGDLQGLKRREHRVAGHRCPPGEVEIMTRWNAERRWSLEP